MNRGPTLPLKVLSYNTLIEKQSYTPTVKSDAQWRNLNWRQRREQLILKIVTESADVICLQEIRHAPRAQPPNFNDFYQPLKQMGFEGVFARRNIDGEFGEEGVAIFFNLKNLYLVQTHVLYFQDGTGRLALAVTLRSSQGHIFRVVNTHIVYPESMSKTQKEIQLLSEWGILHDTQIPCIVAGDFNLCRAVGFHKKILDKIETILVDSHEAVGCETGTFCLNSVGSNSPGMIKQELAIKLDYIYASKQIEIVTAGVVGSLQDLPSSNEPSDHLPVFAELGLPPNARTVLSDLQLLQKLIGEANNRNYNSDPKFKQFIDIFWLLPRSVKNLAYELTYRFALKMGFFQSNLEFGRVAFTNNTFREETILNADGDKIFRKLYPVRSGALPIQQLSKILAIIKGRVQIIPQLIEQLPKINHDQFKKMFDELLDEETKNDIYGETYKVATERKRDTNHVDYGRVSFRKVHGWDVPEGIRLEALRRVLLP